MFIRQLEFKQKAIYIIAFSFSLCSLNLQAQELMRPFAGYSKKKVAYITMDDGTKIQANLKDFKYKKGLIEVIKLKDISGGKKQKIIKKG